MLSFQNGFDFLIFSKLLYFLKRDPNGRQTQTDAKKVDINGMERSRNLEISKLNSHKFISIESPAKLIEKTDIPSECVLMPSGYFHPYDTNLDENRDQTACAQHPSINNPPYISR